MKTALFLELKGSVVPADKWAEEKAKEFLEETRNIKGLTAVSRASIVTKLFHPITENAVRKRDERARREENDEC